ncbi:MAG TPA: sialidase family protein [Thermoanaerobaculia bacterium]|nr:sialidase family protein [Thermoanaerobaculia bacterium]
MIRRRASLHGAALLAGLCGLLAAPALRADGSGRQAGANVRLNDPQLSLPFGQLGRVGMAVAASPDGTQILAGWDDVQGMCGPPMGRPCPPESTPGLTGVGYSTDGGRTWTDLGAPPTAAGFMTGGHVWIDRGGADNQTFFVLSRARKLDDPGPLGQIGFVLNRGRFENGAFVWTDSQYLAPAKQGDLWRGPTLVAAKDGSGRVFMALSNSQALCGEPTTGSGQIEVLRSADGGTTWEGPVIAGRDETYVTVAGDLSCAARGRFQASPSIALGPWGEIYVTWQYGPPFQLYYDPIWQETPPTAAAAFSRSLDGGRSFSLPRILTTTNSMIENQPAGFNKDLMNDIPRLAVATAGPHRGRLYVTYASAVREVHCTSYYFGPKDYSPASSQTWLIWSDDRGESWSAAVPLGPPLPPAGVKRFFPAIATGPDGTVDVIYLESREAQFTADPHDLECPTPTPVGYFRMGRAHSLVDLMWVRSTDGGASFGPPVRVTSQTSDWCATQADIAGFLFPNFGDFVGLSAGRDRSYAIWTDGRNGVPDAYFATLGERAP